MRARCACVFACSACLLPSVDQQVTRLVDLGVHVLAGCQKSRCELLLRKGKARSTRSWPSVQNGSPSALALLLRLNGKTLQSSHDAQTEHQRAKPIPDSARGDQVAHRAITESTCKPSQSSCQRWLTHRTGCARSHDRPPTTHSPTLDGCTVLSRTTSNSLVTTPASTSRARRSLKASTVFSAS